MEDAVQKFIDDMTASGISVTIEAGLVIYRVTPVDGAYAGRDVETGVDKSELAHWPQVPPHWIHLPSSVSFPRTNSRKSPKSGWLKHSRTSGWGDAPPVVSWMSHVRAVLSEAIA